MTKINVKKIRYPLTHHVSAVYGFILGFYQDHGYMPALSDICAPFGKSKSWAQLMLRELARMRKIRVYPGKHRGIVLLIKKENNSDGGR